MPHPIRVDDGSASRLADRQHPAVHVLRHAGQHVFRRRAHPGRPVAAHEFVVAAEAARRYQDPLTAQPDLAGNLASPPLSTQPPPAPTALPSPPPPHPPA